MTHWESEPRCPHHSATEGRNYTAGSSEGRAGGAPLWRTGWRFRHQASSLLPWDGDFRPSVPTGDNGGYDHTEAHVRALCPEAQTRHSAGAPDRCRDTRPVPFPRDGPRGNRGVVRGYSNELDESRGDRAECKGQTFSGTFRKHMTTAGPRRRGAGGRSGAGRGPRACGRPSG